MTTSLSGRLAPLAILALLSGACGSDPAVPRQTEDRPLFGAAGASTTVLTREGRLAMPSAADGGRFVGGWWPLRARGGLRLVPLADGSWLEVTHLRPELARLHLVIDDPSGVAAQARTGDRDLEVTATDSGLVIELPADLPLGRHAVELRFEPREAPILVRGGVIRPPRPPGSASFDASESVCLEGDVLVEALRGDFEPGSRLVGRFAAPRDSNGRHFEVRIEDARGGSRSVHRWPGSGPERLDVDLGDGPGPLRIEFLGSGDGTPGCWRELALRRPRESTEVQARPGAMTPRPEPPKLVLLYVMDALRADFLGHIAVARGSDVAPPKPLSPHLDQLASSGTTFLEHFAVAPNTLPSTKALFTGRAFVDRGGWKLPADAGPTLAEQLRSRGYRTALLSANGYVGTSFGTDRGFDYVDQDVLFDDKDQSLVNDSSEQVHAAARRWLEGLDPDQPAFLYLHTLNPHNPYRPPAPWIDRFTRGIDSTIDGSTATLLDIQHGRRDVGAADQQRLRALYAASVAYNDAQIGELLSFLASRYTPEEMLLVFTSDHGEELFEHDGVLHGYTLYREMLHIPLIIWAPGRAPARQITASTDTLDLFVSLLELADAEVPSGAQGRSLLPLLDGAALDQGIRFASAASVDGGIFAARTRDWNLIWAPRTGHDWGMGNGRGRSRDGQYVFDLRSDPGERDNLSSRALETDWLRSQLLAWVERGRSRDQAEEPPIDPETRRHLESLGYIDG